MKLAAAFAIAAAILATVNAYAEPLSPAVTASKGKNNWITLSAIFYGCTKDQHLGTFTHVTTYKPADPLYLPTEKQIEDVRQAYMETVGRARGEFINATISVRNYHQVKDMMPFDLSRQELDLMLREDNARALLDEKLNQILQNQSGHGDPEALRLLDSGTNYTMGIPRSGRTYSGAPSPHCQTPI
jgi:hypothetical protein